MTNLDYDLYHLRTPFLRGKVLINYITAGFPSKADTPNLLLKLQQLGTDIIELGVPFSDPVADGPTIQMANNIALENGITLADIFKIVNNARKNGLIIPVVLMGYYNVFYQYGMEQVMIKSRENGINGFIIVDLQPELDLNYVKLCEKYKRGLIPLISITSNKDRILTLTKFANCFIYCVAVTGVTGSRETLDRSITYINRRS